MKKLKYNLGDTLGNFIKNNSEADSYLIKKLKEQIEGVSTSKPKYLEWLKEDKHERKQK